MVVVPPTVKLPTSTVLPETQTSSSKSTLLTNWEVPLTYAAPTTEIFPTHIFPPTSALIPVIFDPSP